MKHIIILLLFPFVLLSCGSSKEINNEKEAVEATSTDQTEKVEGSNMTKGAEISEGIVRDMSDKEGCGFLIEVELNGEKTLLEPLALSQEFKVDGKSIKIQYRMSRRPSKCLLAIPIVIDTIRQ